MLYMNVTQPAAVTVPNLEALRELWRTYGGDAILGTITVQTRLTGAQRRRLPKALRDRVVLEVSR